MNNQEISIPHLDMSNDIKMAILEAIRTNEYYNYACVFYYIFQNDIALLSEEHEIWAHKVNTENNHWVIVDKNYIINLYKDSLNSEFNKLIDYYRCQISHESCPYSQTIDNLTNALNTMQHYGHTVVDESAQFFKIEDFKYFISNYLTHENLIEFTADFFLSQLDY
jgi:hypothetical protein